MKKNLRPEPGTLLLDDKNEWEHRREVVDRVVETDDQLVVHSILTVILFDVNGEVTETYRHKSTQKRQKFLCVNGPLQGQRVVQDEAPEYFIFNRGRGCSGAYGFPKRNAEIPTAILVWTGAFK